MSTQSTQSANDQGTNRPLSIAHLVFGLIFGGIATLWFIGNASNAEIDHQAAGLPVVLIGAGVIGLIAAVISRRQSMKRLATSHTESIAVGENSTEVNSEPSTDQPEDTIILTDQKDES